MTAPHLPDDCVHNILKYLKNNHNNLSTLFNCSLVNRSWCNEAIPFLYVNPFENICDYTKYNSDSKNKFSITWTLILCFDEKDLSDLKNHIEFQNEINKEYKPLFDYPKYIKYFNGIQIKKIIKEWFNQNCYQYNESIISIFYHSILRKCIYLKKLDSCPNLFNFSIEFIKNFNLKLSKLNSLTLKRNINNFELEFLILNTCFNLKHLNIDTTKKEICSIIKKQNNLKSIQLKCFEISSISNLLESQKFSLTYIEFDSTDFKYTSLKNFENFINLKFLIFNNCKNINSDQINIFNFTSFKLKELKINCYLWGYNDKISIIKSLGKSLQRLILLENIGIPSKLYKAITNYCSNLITLDISMGYMINIKSFSYFKSLKIRKLNVISVDGVNDNKRNEVLSHLAQNLPITVKEVSICYYRNISCGDIFKIFLCHDYLEVLNLECDTSSKELIGILDHLGHYIKYNYNLKSLGIRNLITDKELLDGFKGKGIKIEEFNNIYRKSNYFYENYITRQHVEPFTFTNFRLFAW